MKTMQGKRNAISRLVLAAGCAVAFFAFFGCSAFKRIDRSDPESVLVDFEYRKAQGDAEGAIELMSPALKEAFETIGGPARARYQMNVEYQEMKKHGGIKEIQILDREPTGENTCRIRCEITAKDGTTVSGHRDLALIDGKWYIGPAKSVVEIQTEPEVPLPPEAPPLPQAEPPRIPGT